MQQLCVSAWQEYLPRIGKVIAVPACNYSDRNFTAIGINFSITMLQILASPKTLNVPENLKLQNPFYDKWRFE